MERGAPQVGEVTITRLEEAYGPVFPAGLLLPEWDEGIRDDHGRVIDQFVDAADFALVSVHTWVVRTPQSTIVVDMCNGNHTPHAMDEMAMLDTDWFDRLVASGVRPAEVDAVVCTHLHLDHVGWNTTLVDGERVPTFPNARYLVNATEFAFWDPAATDQTGRELNANVFDDSVRPVFDRGLVELWDGDDWAVDDTFHLELAAGHTPGHSVGWIRSGGEHALFSGDSMHSAAQV